MMSQAFQILYIGLFFDANHTVPISQVGYITKRLMRSFNLNIG